MDEWPRAYPCRRGEWTVSDGKRWATVEPAGDGAGGNTGRGPVVVDPADDPELVGLAAALSAGDLVSYRHHRRAVVHTRTGFIKVTVPKKTEAIRLRHRLVAELGVPAPAIVADYPDGRLELTTAPGISLHQLAVGATFDPGWIDAVAELMADLHQHQPLHLPAHDPAPTWIDTTARADSELAVELARVFSELPPLPTGGHHLIHADLHDKNILLALDCTRPSGDLGRTEPYPSAQPRSRSWRGALIDLDGLAVGEPTIDVGNLSAHVKLRALQGQVSHAAADYFGRELLADYRSRRDIDLDVVHVVERHTWLRLAALYRFRRSGQHLVSLLLDLAADGLGR